MQASTMPNIDTSTDYFDSEVDQQIRHSEGKGRGTTRHYRIPCHRCGSHTHLASQCTRHTMTCHRCGSDTHLGSQCHMSVHPDDAEGEVTIQADTTGYDTGDEEAAYNASIMECVIHASDDELRTLAANVREDGRVPGCEDISLDRLGYCSNCGQLIEQEDATEPEESLHPSAEPIISSPTAETGSVTAGSAVATTGWMPIDTFIAQTNDELDIMESSASASMPECPTPTQQPQVYYPPLPQVLDIHGNPAAPMLDSMEPTPVLESMESEPEPSIAHTSAIAEAEARAHGIRATVRLQALRHQMDVLRQRHVMEADELKRASEHLSPPEKLRQRQLQFNKHMRERQDVCDDFNLRVEHEESVVASQTQNMADGGTSTSQSSGSQPTISYAQWRPIQSCVGYSNDTATATEEQSQDTAEDDGHNRTDA